MESETVSFPDAGIPLSRRGHEATPSQALPRPNVYATPPPEVGRAQAKASPSGRARKRLTERKPAVSAANLAKRRGAVVQSLLCRGAYFYHTLEHGGEVP